MMPDPARPAVISIDSLAVEPLPQRPTAAILPSRFAAGGFLGNLRSGLRFALLRRVALEDFCSTLDQLVWLVLLNLALAFVADYALTQSPRLFNYHGLRAAGFAVAIEFLAVYVVARIVRPPSIGAVAIPLLVILFSLSPVTRVWSAIVDWTPYADPETFQLRPTYLVLSSSLCLWGFLMSYRAIRLATGSTRLRLVAAYFAYLVLALMPSFLPRERMWLTSSDDPAVGSAKFDRWRGVSRQEAEGVLNAQPGRVHDEDAKLRGDRKGVVDLYFIGFAAYADQDVFFKEVAYARDLFDGRFDTSGRSVMLVNNPATKDSLPIASVTNLRATLRDVGRKMNPAEDVLFLLLASHGGRNHELVVQNGSLPLEQVTAGVISSALDDAGIRWRVIVIDACYSGGFIEPLKSARTMVITSSSPYHTSYGCGDEAEMTYFGRAFLRHGLSWKDSFTDSFADAASLIGRWEDLEGRDHSRPQIFVGSAIGAKMKTLDERLERERASRRRPMAVADGAR